MIFLDGDGEVVLNFSSSNSPLIQGPWDMTADESYPDDPILYVSNVLSGAVIRIKLHVEPGPVPRIESVTKVASGFLTRTDPNALVVGPTGVLLSHDGRDLYVADTGNNRIQLVRGVRDTITDRGSGETIVARGPLKGPLALAWTPRGTIMTSNGDAVGSPDAQQQNRVVEFDPEDREFVATRQLDKTPTAGAIFGIAIAPFFGEISLFYVNDNSATLNVLSPR